MFSYFIYIYKDKMAAANLDCRSLKSLKNIQIYQNYQFSQKKEAYKKVSCSGESSEHETFLYLT